MRGARQALELFLAWALGFRVLCALVLREDVHKHRPKVLTKNGPQILSEEGVVSVFVVCWLFESGNSGRQHADTHPGRRSAALLAAPHLHLSCQHIVTPSLSS